MKTKHMPIKIGFSEERAIIITVNDKRIGPRLALELGTLLIRAGNEALPASVARGILIEAQELASQVKVVGMLDSKLKE